MKLPINYERATSFERKQAREAYVKQQNGLCHHCKEPLSGEPAAFVREASINPRPFPPNFFKWPIHLHHCHHSGLTIGAVHARCNAYLWQYEGE